MLLEQCWKWQHDHCTAQHTSKMSIDGWWMVQTTVRPVSTVLRTARITIAAARAFRPVDGSPYLIIPRRSRCKQQPTVMCVMVLVNCQDRHLPVVGSSMKTMDGLAASSTAIVSRLRCCTLSPFCPAPCNHSRCQMLLHARLAARCPSTVTHFSHVQDT